MFLKPALLLLTVLPHSGPETNCVIDGVLGQFMNCNWVNSLDCTHYTSSAICASDGRDYANRCIFAKAQCLDQSLRTVDEGPCASLGFGLTAPTTTFPTTTRPTTTRTTTLPPKFTAATVTHPTSDLLHVICDKISRVHCANDIEPVCGSDDRTYVNTCEFHKEVCQRHGLTVKHIGFC